jgi:nanoRNase/pAp phosphatase (c-di-AMP/oligoRNAs hydrolase)
MYKDKYPDALFVACLTTDGRYELRSNNQSSNFDVGSFARQFGGGGQFHASGFDSRTCS